MNLEIEKILYEKILPHEKKNCLIKLILHKENICTIAMESRYRIEIPNMKIIDKKISELFWALSEKERLDFNKFITAIRL